MNAENFCQKHKVWATVTRVKKNPFVDPHDWPKDSKSYEVTLTIPDPATNGTTRREMSVYWSQGPGVKGQPTAADVLDCICSDACTVDNAANFEEWADELGYNKDSRKAEKMYHVVKAQAADLKNFLGDLYDFAVFEMKRM